MSFIKLVKNARSRSLRRSILGGSIGFLAALGLGVGLAGAHFGGQSQPATAHAGRAGVNLATDHLGAVKKNSRSTFVSSVAGYDLGATDGGVFAFPQTLTGPSLFHGSMGGQPLNQPVVGMAGDSAGYWLAAKDGGVFRFGTVGYFGSLPQLGINVDNIVGIAADSTMGGYYLVGSTGAVYAFGNANFKGSLPGDGVHVNDIVGIAAAPGNSGYWLVGADGGIFSFPTTLYRGSVPASGVHVGNIKGIAATTTGIGYWLVGADGGVFSFGDASYLGSVPGVGISISNVVAIIATSDSGYWLVGSDGGIFTFGSASFYGSLPGLGVHVNNIVGGINTYGTPVTPTTTSTTTLPHIESVVSKGISARAPTAAYNSGPTAGGNTVTLAGKNFTSSSTVTFGGVSAEVTATGSPAVSCTYSSPERIVCVAPSHIAGSVTIQVTTTLGASNKKSYNYDNAPSITSITPIGGPTTGDTTVKITGTYFTPTSIVTFGPTLPGTSVTVVSATEIDVKSPSHEAAVEDTLNVTTPGGTSNDVTYKWAAAPTLVSITPPIGKIAGGTTVTITGYNFTTASVVWFGTTTATVLTNTFTTTTTVTVITVTTPANLTPGNYTVTVTALGGQSNSGSFTVIPAPSITSVSPHAGAKAGGYKVTLTGQHFVPTITVKVTGVAVTSNDITVTGTTITITPMPSGLGGENITVTAFGGKSTATTGHFFYGVPKLTKITKSHGPKSGRKNVTLSGSGFTPTSKVYVCTVEVTSSNVNVTTGTFITVTIPSSLTAPKTCPVYVTNTDTTDTSGKSNTKTFTYDPKPTLTSLTKAKGKAVGGTSVTLNLKTLVTATLKVYWNGEVLPKATYSVTLTNQTITVTTPSHALGGSVTVSVSDAGGTTTTLTYTYFVAPKLTEITKSKGKAAGGQKVTLKCKTLVSTTVKVTWNGVTIPKATFTVTGTSITLTTPAHTTGGTVTVKVSDVGGSTSAKKYKYVKAPILTTVTKNKGKAAGAQEVVLRMTTLVTTTLVVHWNGTILPARTYSVSGTTITISDDPSHNAGGAVKVYVSDVGGTSSTKTFTYYKAPQLTTLSPTKGKVAGGTKVTLHLKTLATTTLKVYWNGTALSSSTYKVTGTTITITSIPSHTAGGFVDVKVSEVGGTSTKREFAYVKGPKLTSVTPDKGKAAGGNKVTLHCKTLVSTTFAVYWNGTLLSASTYKRTGTTVTITSTPAHTAGGAVNVQVKDFGGTSSTKTFTYVKAPTFTSVTPGKGPTAGGIKVTLHFKTLVTTTLKLYWNGSLVPVAAYKVTGTTITITSIIGHSAGSVNVKVSNVGGTSGTKTFTYMNKPHTLSLTPDAIPVTTATRTITITGKTFTSTMTVTFGGTKFTNDGRTSTTAWVASSQTSTQVKIVAPSHTKEEVTVTARNPGGYSDTVPFFYGPATLTKVTLNVGKLSGGNQVTLDGSDFATTSTVYFGATKVATATVDVVSTTEIKVTVPAHAKGKVTVKVKTGGGTSNTKSYTYVTKAKITSMTPTAGKTSGGTTVHIHGTNFIAPITVTFGTTPGTNVVIVSSTLITVRAPAHAPGKVQVKVTTPGGVATTAKTYTFEARPAITSLTPPAGPATSVKKVTITGSGFVNGATTVKVGGTTIAATKVTVTSATTMKVTFPVHIPGAVGVTVATAGGTSLPYTYIYDATPTITQLTPKSAAAGTVITITGTGFTSTTTVTFTSTAGLTVNVISTSTLKVKVPAHALGAVTVTVTTPGGKSAGKAFTYVTTPAFALTSKVFFTHEKLAHVKGQLLLTYRRTRRS